ncbi:YoaK family protein [Microbacterium horticulturae]|uniref:YoaK family protein n=1 Tax=Microbacterium horticulturae TaxID=3028316 RepID=A0ABY8BXQ0_9MICO|nr:YoaK family protein [Microbacterium sp. KACC 23027]WEG08660.1 YoaK family protein [Microbacterium sp. KACC 23027]
MATGVVDAVSYLALDHVFTGSMTSNVLFVGFGLTSSGEVPLLNNALALAGFLAGTVVAGRIVRGRTHATRLPSTHLTLRPGTALGDRLAAAGIAPRRVAARLDRGTRDCDGHPGCGCAGRGSPA